MKSIVHTSRCQQARVKGLTGPGVGEELYSNRTCISADTMLRFDLPYHV